MRRTKKIPNAKHKVKDTPASISVQSDALNSGIALATHKKGSSSGILMGN
jgi:hypothetical protein